MQIGGVFYYTLAQLCSVTITTNKTTGFKLSLDTLSIEALSIALFLLIIMSAMFSASETAMMAVNRYRIKHQADSGSYGAKLILKLLETPDRLLGTILIGNNIANIAATLISGMIGMKLYGNAGTIIAGWVLLFIILVFAEVAPKTLAATNPERIAFPAAYALSALLFVLTPLVRLVNILSNGLLKIFGISVIAQSDSLTAEELRAAVKQFGGMLNQSHKEMLLRILEMEKITINEIMVPRAEIEAIDLNDEWEEIVEQLATSHHTRIPIYKGSLDNVVGILHLRKALYLSQTSKFNKQALEDMIRDPYFIPENLSITQALRNLQNKRRRFGIAVDEYGDIKGLVTLEEILEEIVGEFTTIIPGIDDDIHEQDDGSFLVDGAAYIRDLNRQMNWQLPHDKAKTLNGLIIEHLEEIPQANTSFKLENYMIEVIQTRDSAVHVARIRTGAKK